MEEARDTPVLMIIEKPNLPPKPEPRGIAKFGALAIILEDFSESNSASRWIFRIAGEPKLTRRNGGRRLRRP